MDRNKKTLKIGISAFIGAVLLLQAGFFAFASAHKKDVQAPTAPAKLTASNITFTSIALSWAASSDDYGVKGYHVYRDGKKIISTSKTSYTNSNLIPGKKYTYTVRAYDAAGNVSSESTPLPVSAQADTKAPSPPSSLSAVSADYTSVTLSWIPSSDNVSVKGYEIYRNGSKAGSSSSAGYTCKRLSPGKSYDFFVIAYDLSGNRSSQSNRLTAATMADIEAPSTPKALKATYISETEATLSWSPCSDNFKVKNYQIFRDGSKIKTTAQTNFCCTGLLPGKTYQFAVKAADSAGNISGSSSPLAVTTLKDTAPPSAPENLKACSSGKSSVALSWSASSDNTKVKTYLIYCNGFQIGSSSKTSYTAKHKSGSAVNIYWVTACDIAGNISGRSNSVTVLNLTR